VTIKLAAILAIWALCALNILSVRISAGFMRWITWLKLGLLTLIVVWATVFHLGSWTNFLPFAAQRPGSLPLGPALGVGMMAAFYSFGGWWEVSKIAGEVRNPGRTLQRAMIFGVLLVTAVYVLVSAVFLYLVPLEKVGSDETFVAQVGAVLFGPTGGITFAAIVVICVLGGLAGFVMAAPRVYYAMAKDGLFLPAVARLHPRYGTPAAAIAIQGTIGTLLVAVSSFQQIISYFIFAAVFFVGFAAAGLFRMRNTSRNNKSLDGKTAILAPGYPFTPVVYLVFIVLTLVVLALHAPRESALGVVVVLAGVPVYQVFQRKRAQDAIPQGSTEEASS
jgi:APA family basic amino acid/polyamine antiporter